MATRIEVIVEKPDGEHRAVVIPGKGVRAIFLETSFAETTLKTTAKKERPPLASVSVEGPLTDDGRGDANVAFEVCYLVGGQLFCW